jgi:thioesterase domain-containing protein
LALEISYILAQDNDIQVAGLVLIDTPYPKVGDKPPAGANYMPDLPGVRPQLRRRIHSSIQHAKNMVLLWQLPKWEAAGNFEDLEHANSDMSMPRYNRRNNPPPAVLLRATNAMKIRGNNIEPVALVDIARHDPSLGWNQYENTFIEAVWEIPGNHFGLFDAPYVNHVTEKLANACAYLCPETNKL